MQTRAYIEKNIIIKIHLTPQESRQKVKAIIPKIQNFIKVYSAAIHKKYKSFPLLTFDTYKLEKNKNNASIYYLYIYTKPLNNHPFLVEGNINNDYFFIYIPFGEKYGQVDINTIFKLIDLFKANELYGLYLLLQKIIEIRQQNIIVNPQFSIFKCENIKNCALLLKNIKLNMYPPDKRREIIQKLTIPFIEKGKAIIINYFTMLKNYNFDDAYQYLGKKNNSKSKYWHKQRIDNYFINNKQIIGHLEIFISLYKLKEAIEMQVK